MPLGELSALDDLGSWRLYLRVCALGSIAAAAREAELDPSTVSRRIARLEEVLGSRLLEKDGRSVRATRHGETVALKVSAALNLFDTAVAGVSPHDHAQTRMQSLRISMPYCLADHFISDWMQEFQLTHPDTRIHLEIADRVIDPDKSNCDLSFHCGYKAIGSERSMLIGAFARVMVASPAYIEKTGMPGSLEELFDHRLFCYDGPMSDTIVLFHDKTQNRLPLHRMHFLCTTTAPLLTLVKRGEGILVSTPLYMCAKELENGELVRVLPDFKEAAKGVHLMESSESKTKPIVEKARRFLVQKWQKNPLLLSAKAFTRENLRLMQTPIR